MTIWTSIGIAFAVYMTLIGIAIHIYVAWQGVVRLRGHLDIGRLTENGAVGDHLNMRAQLERVQR